MKNNLLLLSGVHVELNALDDADGDGLAHIPDSEPSKGGELGETLDAEGLAGLELDNAGIAGLDELGVLLEDLSGTPVHLLLDEGKLAGDVGGVAIEDGGIAVRDLAGVVHDDDLGIEGLGAEGRVLLGVRGDESTPEVLDGNVLDVESDVVSGDGLGEGLVVHLNGLDLSGDASGGELGDHAGLDDAGLDAADGHSADSADLVDILEGEAEGLVGGPLGGVAVVKGLQDERAIC